MSLETYTVLFQAVAFLFAISVHESAHAWTANRCGDPTARMLGRITLNPLKHIDPVGTIVMPAIAYFTGFPMIGWAKPTPVDTRHFKNPVWDDIKTSLAGPISNLIIATGSVIVLGVISKIGDFGHQVVQIVGTGGVPDSRSPLVPLALLAYQFLIMNIILAAFNVIPIPPLDGSHVVRHFLPESMRQAYDMIGMFGLIILLLVGGKLLAFFAAPLFHFFGYIIAKINA